MMAELKHVKLTIKMEILSSLNSTLTLFSDNVITYLKRSVFVNVS